ncbi:TetR/AcrR family transcriptional regulator [Agrobacterium rhizogenes]|nr:TetR/AcrR family transcriptional regulator [Rhizobium rhizogenes]
MDRILAAALHIIDDEGIDALTMRNLAGKMNSGTAMLYRHFASRSDLTMKVADLLFADSDATIGKDITWQEFCRILAHRMFDALSRHPGVARLLVESAPTGPNAFAQRERSLSLLLSSGFPPEMAARAYTTLAHFVLGFAVQFAGHGRQNEQSVGKIAAITQLDPVLFPATIAVSHALPIPLEEEFSFGLELLIDGIARLRAETAKS